MARRARMLRAGLLLLAGLSAQAATTVYQASFEAPAAGYTVVRGAGALDAAVLRENRKSLRVEPAGTAPDAAVRFAPVSLAIGKRFVFNDTASTENLEV